MSSNTERIPRQGLAISQIVAKIFISILFGAVAFVLSVALSARANQDITIGIGVSVFVSGLAFVTQFLVDVETRMNELSVEVQQMGTRYDEQLATTQELIRHEFVQINAATELFGLVEASALRTDAVTQMVKNATTIEKNTPSLIFDFAQLQMMRLSQMLRDLGQAADVAYDGEDRDMLLTLTTAAALSIDATSLTTVDAGGHGFVDGGLWGSDLGQRYLEAQRNAIAKGVKIRRIFILDRPELRMSRELVSVLQDHHDIGVDVRTLNPEEEERLTPARRALLVDFIVMDGVVVYQSNTVNRPAEGTRPIIVETRLVTNPDRVMTHIERYRDLWAVAKPFPPPASGSQTNT